MEKIQKHEELFDDKLMQLMGDQYTDLTQEPAKPAEAETENTVEWEPIGSDIAKIGQVVGAAKWALTFGGLFGLILYWQLTGLMDPAAAGPSMCVCTALAGYGIGKHVHK
jgi:hypothetical protein